MSFLYAKRILLHNFPVTKSHVLRRNLSYSLNEFQYNMIAETSLEFLLDTIDNSQSRATNIKEDVEVSLSVRECENIIYILIV